MASLSSPHVSEQSTIVTLISISEPKVANVNPKVPDSFLRYNSFQSSRPTRGMSLGVPMRLPLRTWFASLEFLELNSLNSILRGTRGQQGFPVRVCVGIPRKMKEESSILIGDVTNQRSTAKGRIRFGASDHNKVLVGSRKCTRPTSSEALQ